MTKERASIFASEDALDLSGFAPKSGPEPSEVSAEIVRAIAEASRFPSREAKPMRRPPRIHRTGRTMQFNARTTPQTVEARNVRFWIAATRSVLVSRFLICSNGG